MFAQFCFWSNAAQACVRLPTTAPTKLPTIGSPTLSPLRPTQSPTLSRPTFSPVYSAPTFAPAPPTPPTRAPSLPCVFPGPNTGCAVLKTKAKCKSFSACVWNVNRCKQNALCVNSPRGDSAKPTKSPTPSTNPAKTESPVFTAAPTSPDEEEVVSAACKVQLLALEASTALLPGCVRGLVSVCDAQRKDVFDGLGLDANCGESPKLKSSALPGVAPKFGVAPPSPTAWPSLPMPTPAPVPTRSPVVPITNSPTTPTAKPTKQPTKRPTYKIGRARRRQLLTYPTTDFWVDPVHGSDYAGTGFYDDPLETVARALELARAYPRTARTIHLMAGTHYLTETIKLTPADTGLKFVGVGAPGAATLSGAIKLSNLAWAPTNANKNVYAAQVPHWIGDMFDPLSELFVNGQPAIRARSPNAKSYFAKTQLIGGGIEYVGYGSTQPTKVSVNRNVNKGNFMYNTHTFVVGGGCTGRFTPAASYFCSPNQQAYGLCTYKMFSAAVLSTSAVNQARVGSWSDADYASAHFHVFHPLRWSMWSMRVGPQPTGGATASPTASASPTKRPTLATSPDGPPPGNGTTTRTPTTVTTTTTTPNGTVVDSDVTPSPTPKKKRKNKKSKRHWNTLRRRSLLDSDLDSDSGEGGDESVEYEYEEDDDATARLTGMPSRRFLAKASGPGTVMIDFEEGGFQEARGDCGYGGNAWFVENALPLLDAPNEFYFDRSTDMLYFMPNGTLPNAKNVVVEMSVLRQLVSVVGTTANPVSNVAFVNVGFTKTVATHMDPHEVPSGGDWTITRQAALFLEGVTDAVVADNTFTYVGGNGVFLSRFIRRVRVQRNAFRGVGSSAIMVVGDPRYSSADPWNGNAPEHVDTVLVSGNVASEVGVWVKQSSGVFLSIAKNILVENNVFYNGPRAGITLNDGYGGNNVFTRNVVFNQVRETNDHGPFNVWDRQKWDAPTLRNVVSRNLFIGTLPGPKGIDLDDGCQYWDILDNVVMWGLMKFKGSDIYASRNLVLFPLAGQSCVMICPACKAPSAFVWSNNTCVAGTNTYDFAGPAKELARICPKSWFSTSANSYFFTGKGSADFTGCDGTKTTFATEWQGAAGQDVGSDVTRGEPSQALIVSWVRERLTWF